MPPAQKFFSFLKRKPKTNPPSSTTTSEDDGDFDCDVIKCPPTVKQLSRPRHSVSAEVYGAWNKRKEFVPPVFEKNPEQEARLREILGKSFMFQELNDEELIKVVNAFVEVTFDIGATIIIQGEEGSSLFVIERGEVDVFKNKENNEETHVCVMTCGDTVGELALLYNTRRAATVRAKTLVVSWKLDRECFNAIVRDAAIKRRDAYESFLKEVELLKETDPYERSKLSDALKTAHFIPGETIITQGDVGDRFYIVEYGKADAFKDGVSVLHYGKGDYFGELSLLNDKPRAATVIAVDRVRCVYLERDSFSRLLGPLEDIMKRNTHRYSTKILDKNN